MEKTEIEKEKEKEKEPTLPSEIKEKTTINIQVVTNPGVVEVLFFKVLQSTKMGKMFRAYAKKNKLPLVRLMFLVDGKVIDENKTVQFYGLEDQDQIDCHVVLHVPADCSTLKEAVKQVHEDSCLTTIVVGRGEHQIDGDYLKIPSAMNILGDLDVPKEMIVIVGGISFEAGIQKNCHLQHTTLRQAQHNGVLGMSSFTMEDVIVEQCGDFGVIVVAGVIGRCTNMEVRHCGKTGVIASMDGSITLAGAKTTVHHNCIHGFSGSYGLGVWGSSSSTVQLISPLTKEKVSTNNGGGGNWGAGSGGDIHQIKQIPSFTALAPASAPSPPIAPTNEPHTVVGETKISTSPLPESFNMDTNCCRCTKKLPKSRFEYMRMSCCGFAYHYKCHYKCLREFYPPNETAEDNVRHREYFRTHQQTCPRCGATLLEGSDEEMIVLKHWCTKGKAWAWSIRGQRFKELFKAKKDARHNASLAHKFYLKAAELGDSVGMQNVGFISACRKQYIDARYWWTKAARVGDEGSIECLELLKERADQDCYIMVELNSCSVDTTVPHSGQWLYEEGMLYWHGSNFKKVDKQHSRLMIEASASSDFPLAVAKCQLMGWHGMELKQKKAFEMCVQIEQETNGYQWAQMFLAGCHEQGDGTDQDYTKAFELYIKASEQGNIFAMTELGNCYYRGQGCNEDDTNGAKAVEWFEKSAHLGDSIAMANLGLCYEEGSEVTKDLSKAREWYTKAAAQGHAGAQTQLDQLKRH